MRSKNFFHLKRGNVLTAAYDHVFFAIHDENVSLLINRGHVAGVEPSILKGIRGTLRIVRIARHHAVAARPDLANRFAIRGHIRAVRMHDSYLYSWNGITSASLTFITLLSLPAQAALHRRNGQHRGSLSEPISGEAGATQLLFNFSHQSWRRGCPADRNPFQTAEVVFLAFRAIHQRKRHRRYQVARMNPFALDQSEHFAGIETVNHD